MPGWPSALDELGFSVDQSVLDARRSTGAVLGRPHLATAVVSHPDNAERLRELDLETIERFIPAYLIRGTPAYEPRTRPTVEEAIGWIHDAGGVAIWAHPFWDVKDSDAVVAKIDRYRAWGLDGVECFYPTYHGGADEAAGRGSLPRARAADHGLVGLPRPEAQDLQPVSGPRASRGGAPAGAIATPPAIDRSRGRIDTTISRSATVRPGRRRPLSLSRESAGPHSSLIASSWWTAITTSLKAGGQACADAGSCAPA